MKNRKRLSNVPRYRYGSRTYMPSLKFIVLDGDNVQLYVRHKGETLVLLEGSLPYVLSIVGGIKDALAEGVPPLLASTERKAAVEEAQDILRGD